jgi:protein-disulfide isomerase
MSVLEQLERDLVVAAHSRLPVEGPGDATAGLRRDRRQRRWPGALLVGVSVVATVLIMVVAVGVLDRSPRASAPNRPGSSVVGQDRRPSQAYAVLARMLAGVPQSATTLGSAQAPVTVVLFADLGSPISRLFARKLLPGVIRGPVRSGEAKVIFRALCTSSCDGAGSGLFNRRQGAALAAGRQHLFWNYALLVLAKQGQKGSERASNAYLKSLANQIPTLNLTRWQHARALPSLRTTLKHDARAAATSGIFSAPTLLIRGRKGRSRKIVGAGTLTQILRAIRQAR